MESSLACFLYHSRLAASADIRCVADIVKIARSFNKEHQITGMLIFDGQRFCQYIEGPQVQLQALIDCIAKDNRHTEFTPKHHAGLSGERMFGSWSMAYVLVDDAEPLDELNQLDGTQAVSKLLGLLPMLDIA